MRRIHRGAVPLVVSAIALAGFTGVARADDAGVLQAIQKQGTKLESSPQYRKLQSIDVVHSAADARQAEKPLRELDQRVRAAARIIAATSGSTAAGRSGKADYVLGLRKIAYGYGILYQACREFVQGRRTTADATAHRAKTSFTQAGKILTRAAGELRTAAKGAV